MSQTKLWKTDVWKTDKLHFGIASVTVSKNSRVEQLQVCTSSIVITDKYGSSECAIVIG